jgi:hypothetical protein
MKAKPRGWGVFSPATMVYVLTTLSVLVLCSTIYANRHLNSLLDVSKRLHTFVSNYMGDSVVESTNIPTSGFVSSTKDIQKSIRVVTSAHSDKSSSAASVPTRASKPDVNIPTDASEPAASVPTHESKLTASAPTHASKPAVSVSTHGHTASTGRPSECSSCFQHNFDFILDHPDICHPKNSSIKVLVLIATVHGNTEKRKAIRETWLSPYKGNTGSVRYAFLLGMTSDKALQVAVETESATYQDILQEDFVDAYNNLTLKTLMALRWASTMCQNAEFVMKTDDDMYVNLHSMPSVLDKYKDVLQRSVGGFCVQSASPVRDKSSKWYVSMKMYPHSRYHGYCSGTGYVVSMAVAQKVFNISKHIPFFHLEDIYVGLCINKLKFAFTRIPGFNPSFIRISCNYKRRSVITSHQVSPQQMRQIWDMKC